jgi:hypothetical protein
VTGLLLILLGAWGALVPFVGPYFHFAYTPDRAWAYTTGRLWLEIVPGGVAALAGLIVLATRSRALGGLAAFVAALGGAWFVVGTAVTHQFIKSGSINPGVPASTASLRQFLEGMGFFTGIGVLIVFFAALALGRFAATVTEVGPQPWDGLGHGQYSAQESFPSGTDQFPTVGSQYPAESTQASPTGEYPPPATGQFPATTGPFPPSGTSEPGPATS